MPTCPRADLLAAIPRSAIACAFAAAIGCSSSLPSPPTLAPPTDAYREVPYPPPPARVEYVPDRPSGDVAWVDGSWTWEGTKWRWTAGAWYAIPPRGTFYSPWATSRPDDGRLLFAASSWRDASGREVPTPRPLLEGKTSGARDVDSQEQAQAANPSSHPGEKSP